MKAENKTTDHNRTIRFTDLPLKVRHKDEPPTELLVTVNYAGGSSCNKAIPLDNIIIPLIVAAPDLLEACRAVLAWGDRECMPSGGKSDCPFEMIEAALAKSKPTL